MEHSVKLTNTDLPARPIDSFITIKRGAGQACSWLSARSGCKTDVGADFKNFAARDVDRARFRAARLGDIARAGAVDRRHTRASSFAVVRRHGRGLAQRLTTRLCVGFRSKNHMAAGNFIGVKPPIVRFSDFDAQVVVVSVRCTDEQFPTTWKLVVDDARLYFAQYRSDWARGVITCRTVS